MVTYDNSCLKCMNFTRQKKCIAFPDGIPEEIWIGKNDHKQPYPGDNGIHFYPIGSRENKNDTQAQRKNNL